MEAWGDGRGGVQWWPVAAGGEACSRGGGGRPKSPAALHCNAQAAPPQFSNLGSAVDAGRGEECVPFAVMCDAAIWPPHRIQITEGGPSSLKSQVKEMKCLPCLPPQMLTLVWTLLRQGPEGKPVANKVRGHPAGSGTGCSVRCHLDGLTPLLLQQGGACLLA